MKSKNEKKIVPIYLYLIKIVDVIHVSTKFLRAITKMLSVD